MNLKLVSLFTSILIFGGIALGLQACEEDAENIRNEFSIDGETFALAHGELELYQFQHPTTGNAMYKWTVNLQSDELASIWHWVRFDLNSAVGTTLAPGTYTYDSNNSKDNFTFFFGEVMKNYDTAHGEGDHYEDFESGTVTIARSNGTYTVLLDIVIAGGARVKGTFSGSLHVGQ